MTRVYICKKFNTVGQLVDWSAGIIVQLNTSITCNRIFSKGALFYSPVDFTDASDLHQSVQVW